MKKIIIFIITLCFLSAESQAQCYLKYTDASGLSLTTKQLDSLMDSACALRDVFPKALQDSFAVVDFGFYAYNENMDGGYPEFMNLMTKRLAENPKTKYYLLFGRESSSARGPNSKIWIKVVLPRWGNFFCMSEVKRNLVGIKCRKTLDSIYTVQKVEQVYYSEFGVIKNLKAQVTHIKNCCSTRDNNSCSLECVEKKDIPDILKDANFTLLGPIKVEAKSPNAPKLPNVFNEAKSLQLKTDTIETFAADIIKELTKRKKSYAYIIDDDYYCDNEGLGGVGTKYHEKLDDYDFILYVQKTDNNGNGQLWVKIQGEFFEDENDETYKAINSKNTTETQRQKANVKSVDKLNIPLSRIPKNVYFLCDDDLTKVLDANKVIEGIKQKYATSKSKLLNEVHFNNETNLYYGTLDVVESGVNLYLPSAIPESVKSKDYSICLFRRVGKTCTESKIVTWNPAKGIAKDAIKNLQGDWKTTCVDAIGAIDPKKLSEDLRKMQVIESTFFVYTRKGFTTYINKNNETDKEPSGKSSKNMIYITEDSKGFVDVEVRFRQDIEIPAGSTNTVQQVVDAGENAIKGSLKELITRQNNRDSKNKLIDKIDPRKGFFDKNAADYFKNHGIEGANKELEQDVNGKVTNTGTQILGELGEGGGFIYRETSFSEMFAFIAKSYNDIVDKAKIPDDIWAEHPKEKVPFQDHVYIPSGAVNQLCEDGKDLAGLVGMGLTMVSNPSKAYDSFKDFAVSFGKEPWKSTKEFLKAAGKEQVKYDFFKSLKKDSIGYASGSIVVIVVKTAIGGNFITKLKGAPTELRKRMDDILAILKKLKEKLKKLGCKDIDLDNFVKKFGNNGSFITRFDALDDVLQKKFIDDIAGLDDELLDAFDGGALDFWKKNSSHGICKNKKFMAKYNTLTPDRKLKMDDFMGNQKGYPNGKIDYNHTKNIDIGDGIKKDYTIHYDENGFPDFTKQCPGNNYVFKAGDLKGDAGSSADILRANKAMKQHFGNATSDNFIWDGSSNNFTIRNLKPDGTVYEVKYTWHHHQDCNTMFPVPTKIHNSNSGGFQHSGGAKLIVDDLKNVFNPPIF